MTRPKATHVLIDELLGTRKEAKEKITLSFGACTLAVRDPV